MQLLPLNDLGARESKTKPGSVDFGILLPWVSATDGFKISVKLIHEKDQFLQDIQPKEFFLIHSHHPAADPSYSDYWSTQIDVDTKDKPHPRSQWGLPGRYVYRYCLYNTNSKQLIDWIIDPFAREFGVGKLSAFTLGYTDYQWLYDTNYKTPALEDLIMYELNINEFGGSIDTTIDHLDYLGDLGINCIEVMPVSNVSEVLDWGYLPLGYFGVDERLGKRKDMQKLIDEAHKRGIAVVLDSVYGHTNYNFPYKYIYDNLAYSQNPFMGITAKKYFGEPTDFKRQFTQDFFYTVNVHWLDCYHIDGFRYDCVPEYYDGTLGSGYANLVYNTYQYVKGTNGTNHYARFYNNSSLNLIQCAEQLEAPIEILNKTYSNCTWQNTTFSTAEQIANGTNKDLYPLGMQLGLYDYPISVTTNSDTIKKTALHYIENHDHSRFCCNFRVIPKKDNNDQSYELYKEGDRNLWYKVQPYVIALLTSKGIPMLWQGQEICENYFLIDDGIGRVRMLRPVRWEYFYSEEGKQSISLVRKLIKIRKEKTQFLYGDYYFYNNHYEYQSKNILLFSRRYKNQFSLVALNFGDYDQTVPFTFPINGNYTEDLHGFDNLRNVASNVNTPLKIPSNYGRIWSV
ncbi:MAG: alpha-amylase [Nitrospirae bacterium]|nr:alpha-amylase [Nitrospirota bacterium]